MFVHKIWTKKKNDFYSFTSLQFLTCKTTNRIIIAGTPSYNNVCSPAAAAVVHVTILRRYLL